MSPAANAVCSNCDVALEATDAVGIFVHPQSQWCDVKIAAASGDSLDALYEEINGEIVERDVDSVPLPLGFVEPIKLGKVLIVLGAEEVRPSFDEVAAAIFEKRNLPKPGGASGSLGWSAFSVFQRCPYLFKKQYVDSRGRHIGKEANALVTGNCLHLLLAVRYLRKLHLDYPLTEQEVYDELSSSNLDPEAVDEAGRVFQAYDDYYGDEVGLEVLAVEQLVVDPRTRESCRIDLVAKLPVGHALYAPGVYIWDHKSTARFDDAAITGWSNDGEVMGLVMLWQRMKLDKKYGELKGVMINLLGKQPKNPKFERISVSPMSWQLKGHAEDLRAWHGLRNFYTSINHFPRARANCIGRYGKCALWDHCADSEKDCP